MFSLTRYWIRKGNVARDAHQWPAAQRAYARALLRDPSRAGIWVQYGHALKEGGRLAEALAAYRQSEQLRPGVLDTLAHIAQVAEMLGQSPPLRRHDHADVAARLTPDQLALVAVLRMDMWEIARAVQLERWAAVTLEHLRTRHPDEIALRLRSQAFFWPTADGLGLCPTIGGRLIFVDPHDLKQGMQLINNGHLDAAAICAVARAVKPGMVVADVGANLGYTTMVMAEAAGPRGRVLAYEPDAAIARLLQRSISLNGFGDVVAVDSHAIAGLSAAAGGAPAVALDDALPPQIDFLRIDVAGPVDEVWAGLRGTIGGNPRIRIALTLNAASAPQRIAELLTDIQSRGFKLNYVGDDAQITPCAAEFALRQAPRGITLMLARP